MDELAKRRLFAYECARLLSVNDPLQAARDIALAIEGWANSGVPISVIEAALVPVCVDAHSAQKAVAAAGELISFLRPGEAGPSAAGDR